MDTTITTTELEKNLANILDRVKARGERFVIEHDGEPVATLGPRGPVEGPTLRKLAERMKDVPLPHDGFGDDLAEIKASQPKAKFPEWP